MSYADDAHTANLYQERGHARIGPAHKAAAHVALVFLRSFIQAKIPVHLFLPQLQPHRIVPSHWDFGHQTDFESTGSNPNSTAGAHRRTRLFFFPLEPTIRISATRYGSQLLCFSVVSVNRATDLDRILIGIIVTGASLGFLGLFFTAGAILLIFLTLLGGARNSTPLNEIYFLQADTGNIPGAPTTARWTFWNVCNVTSSGRNDCGSSHPDFPFDPPNSRNFGTTDNVPPEFIG
jgi:hypothetical protein